jgi:hypothetical protein
MALNFSRRLAFAFGVLAPVGETIRRWHTWREWPPRFFDDWIMGALLLYAAYVATREPRRGQRYLAAAWGFAIGLGYASFFGHLEEVMRVGLDAPDPAPIRHVYLLAIIGTGWALCIVALLTTLRRLPDNP